MHNRGTFLLAPSGALVEFKEEKKSLTIVYQLDKNKNRIEQLNCKGEKTYLIGIISNCVRNK
jgi:hypothetical protein